MVSFFFFTLFTLQHYVPASGKINLEHSLEPPTMVERVKTVFVPFAKPSLLVSTFVSGKSERSWLQSQLQCRRRLWNVAKSSRSAQQFTPFQMQQSSSNGSNFDDDGADVLDNEESDFRDEALPDEDSAHLQFREIEVEELSSEVIHEHFQMMIDEAEKRFKFEPNMWAGVPILNTVVLTGRLGRDPEFITTKTGLSICNFSLAVSRESTVVFDSDAENLVDWFDIRTFGKLAEMVRDMGKKGLRVGVTGRVDVSEWTGRDGVKRENVVVTAKTFEVLQSKSEPSFSPGVPNEFGKKRTKKNSDKLDRSSQSDNYITDDDESLGDLPF